MLSAFDGAIFNNSDPFVDYVIKDMVTGEVYAILIDEFGDVYAEPSTLPLGVFDIIDELTGAYYGLFVYSGQVHSAPIRTHGGDVIYATDCFIATGSTVNVRIDRLTNTNTLPEDIEVSVFSYEVQDFLDIDITVQEISNNHFLAPFVIPLPGEFLIVVKLPNGSFISKKIEVQRYSYEELILEIEKAKKELNNNNYEAFI